MSLKLDRISKTFGDRLILNEITLEVQNGEFLVLLGPSGCGKSTLLRIIAGLEEQDQGVIYFDDREISSLPPQKRNVSMVFQSYALYPHMTVRENLSFALRQKRLSKEKIASQVEEIAALIQLTPFLDRTPKELSGGQRQRVALGRALIRKSPLILFDEPLSNLDANLRNQMRIEIKRLHSKLKNTVIYVTHDQTEAMTLGDRIAILNRGRLEQISTPKDIYNRPQTLFVAKFIGSPEMNFFQTPDEVAFRQNCTAGIRPEDIILNAHTPNSLTLDVTVEFIELLGAQSLVHLQTNLGELRALVQADTAPTQGQKVTVHLPMTKIHLFDTSTGTATGGT
ncbi:MAG: ABC transporter ATP-binding protein [Bdellovibrionaceae bacterium]|nr:ABC transporter ATP-binding protein [Pseudobdellovibrionaceae bacterium]